MNPRQLIFSDNEGCIIEAKGKEFNLPELSRLKSLLARADTFGFAICTGRSVPYVEAMTQVLGIHRSEFPCVCEGGGVLYWPAQDRTELLVRPFPTAELLDRLPANLFRVEPGKVCCLSLYPSNALSVQELTEVVAPLVDSSLFTLRVSAAALDITPSGVDKAFGIRKAIEAIKYRSRTVVAVGDADNDLPMFDVADYTAAPSNATHAVKARANFISRFPHTEGLIEILENLKCR